MKSPTLRSVAWAIAALALVGPPAWAWWMSHLDREAQRAAGHEHFCGNGLFAYVVLSCILSALLSLVAVMVGALAYRALPRPRPIRRAWELGLLAVPLVCAVVVGVLLIVAVW